MVTEAKTDSKRLKFLLLVLIILVIAFFGWKFFSNSTKPVIPVVAAKRLIKPKQVSVPATPFGAAKVKTAKMARFINYIGEQISTDSSLSPEEKQDFSSYLSEFSDYATYQREVIDQINTVRQLSEEFFIKKLQAKIADVDKQLALSRPSPNGPSGAPSSINQVTSNQPEQVTTKEKPSPKKNSKNQGENSDLALLSKLKIRLVYGDPNDLKVNIYFNKRNYNSMSVGETIGGRYLIRKITPDRVIFYNSKNDQTYSLNLLD